MGCVCSVSFLFYITFISSWVKQARLRIFWSSEQQQYYVLSSSRSAERNVFEVIPDFVARAIIIDIEMF